MPLRNNKVSPQNEDTCQNKLHTFEAHIMKNVPEDKSSWTEVLEDPNIENYEHTGKCEKGDCSLKSIPCIGEDILGTSVLFLAIAFQKYEIAEDIFNKFPDLISQSSTKSDAYQVLTPFHLAIAFGDTGIVQNLMTKRSTVSEESLTDLLKLEATGIELEGTVFMGKLPLSIAACQGNAKMVDLLLEKGAKIESENDSGDTVFHSLVQFANCFPSKVTNVLDMFEHLLKGEGEIDDHKIKTLKNRNKQSKTALQLSTEFGLVDIFAYLMDAHLQKSRYDLAYELRHYDITDIDKAALLQWRKQEKTYWKDSDCVQSVCESLCGKPLGAAVKMINNESILEILRRKWESSHYCKVAISVGLMHFMALVFLCYYAIDRTHALVGSSLIPVDIIYWINICIGCMALFYLLFETVVRCWFAKQPFYWKASHHNVVYRISAILFGLLLVIDYVQNSQRLVSNSFLVLALLPGSWYLLCYLRCIPHLGVYIVLINEALLYGLLPMSVLILGQISVFSSMMHSLFLQQNSTNVTQQDFEFYGSSMLTMFRLMITLADVDNILDSNEIFVVTFLYVCYIIIVTVLLINALISILTNQFKLTYENRIEIMYVQRLSLVIFIEGLFAVFLPCRVMGNIGTYINHTADRSFHSTFTNRMVLTFRKVRCNEYENPKDIEHEKLDNFMNSSDRLERIENHLDRIEKLLQRDGQQDSSSHVSNVESQFVVNEEPMIRRQTEIAVTPDILSKISYHIPKCWEIVAEHLGLSQNDMKGVTTAMSKGKVQQYVFNMLNIWADRNRPNATCGKLIAVLQKCPEECEIDIDKIKSIRY